MFKTFLRVFLAVGLFAGIHSLLASRQAKQRAARWLGPDTRNGWYRAFYLVQSALTLAALLAYLARVPDRTLYHLRGFPAALLRIGQAGGLVFATLAAREIGFDRVLGIRSLLGWLAQKRRVPPTPEAQGPAPRASGRGLNAAGPFRLTRHPLNLAPLPVFWLAPHMTVKRLAFNLAGTVYLILGSLHEESRLLAAYGADYRRYQRSGVPFYFPKI